MPLPRAVTDGPAQPLSPAQGFDLLGNLFAVLNNTPARRSMSSWPHTPSLDIAIITYRLARWPTSDAVWLVNEAARLTVHDGHARIDDLALAPAFQGLGAASGAS